MMCVFAQTCIIALAAIQLSFAQEQSAECAADPGSEECGMHVELLQRDVHIHSSKLDSKADCKSWCSTKAGKTSWDNVCTWSNCAACSDCPTTTTTTTTSTTTSWQSPFFMMAQTLPECASGKQIKTTTSMTYAEYDAAADSVKDLYHSLSSTCNATYCPQADFAGCVLRIAGHDFMDYKDGEGGSDGCLDFHDHDNAGLAECMYSGEHGVSVADAFKNFCTTISLADFFVIAAEAVMNVSRQYVLDDDATATPVDFRANFKYGRTTALSCNFAEGRLPNPENSCTAVEETFVNSMELSWAQAAALMGVHTLGRAVISNSGYNGWWSDAVNSRKFNNNYYTSIALKGWGPEVSVNGNSGKNQWKRIDSGADEENLGKEMMLNTDMCLMFTMDDDGAVELDAATAEANNCTCTWVGPKQYEEAIETHGEQYCGVDSEDIPGGISESQFKDKRTICCGEEFTSTSDAYIDCGLPISPMGPAATYMKNFANDEDTWLEKFYKAWKAATTNGFSLKNPSN